MGRQLTIRAVATGAVIGTLLTFMNMYYGLQSGWITMSSIQSAMVGFIVLKSLGKFIPALTGFGPLENVVLQTVSVAVCSTPLSLSLYSIIPAYDTIVKNATKYGLTDAEAELITFDYGKIFGWSFSLIFFGLCVAFPLRYLVILKEKLPFPSGTATAEMIRILHRLPGFRYPDNEEDAWKPVGEEEDQEDEEADVEVSGTIEEEGRAADVHKSPEELLVDTESEASENAHLEPVMPYRENESVAESPSLEVETLPISDEKEKEISNSLIIMAIGFVFSGGWSLIVHFVPICGNFPLFSYFGAPDITKFGFTIGVDPSYWGMGMIMGHRVAWSCLAGAILGYGVVMPIVYQNGLAPGEKPLSTGDPESAFTWALWPCIALMLGDSLTSLAILIVRMLIPLCDTKSDEMHYIMRQKREVLAPPTSGTVTNSRSSNIDQDTEERERLRREARRQRVKRNVALDPAPPTEQVPVSWWSTGLVLTTILCIAVQTGMLGGAGVKWWQVLIGCIVGLFIALLAIRALGETDLNPTSGLGKIAQLVMAVVAPGNIVVNLVGGAIAEAAAMSAGDMSQDLKAGHLLGVSPRAQFWAMVVGSTVGVFSSIAAFALYSPLIGTPELEAPMATVWLVFAQGLLNTGLPQGVGPAIAAFFVLGVALSAVYNLFPPTKERKWPNFIPSAIGLAIGFYIQPQYSIGRWFGSVLLMIWGAIDKESANKYYIATASGLVLGHGILSIVEMLLTIGGVTAANYGSCFGCEGIAHFSCTGGC